MIKSIYLPLLFLATLTYGQEKILLNENFNNNKNGWDLRLSSKEFVVKIDKGVLHLEKLHKNFDNRGCLWYSKEINGFDASKDFSIKVDAKRISGGDFTDVLDIQWGVAAKGNINKKAMLYQLNIFMNGAVRLDFFQTKWDNFSKVNIKKKLDAIGFNPKASNEYEVVQRGAFVLLNINHVEVYKQYIFPVEGKSIGFQHCLKGAWEIDKIVVAQLLPLVEKTSQNKVDSSKIAFADSVVTVKNDTSKSFVKTAPNQDASVTNRPIENQGLKIFTKDELIIYPNPFKDAFNAKFDLDEDGDVSIFLINITGKIMKTETKFFKKGAVDFLMEADVPNGVYIVRVVTKNNKSLYKRIVRIES